MGQQRTRHRQRRRQESAESVRSSPPLIDLASLAKPASAPVPIPSPERASAPSSISSGGDTPLVRRDLVRVVVVLAVVAAVLVTLLATNESSGWLTRLADSLYRWLRLG